MTWYVETIVALKDHSVQGYTVSHQVGGDATLPVDIVFKDKRDAVTLAKWLNRKDDWIDRLELIIEHETDVDLEKLKEQRDKI